MVLDLEAGCIEIRQYCRQIIFKAYKRRGGIEGMWYSRHMEVCIFWQRDGLTTDYPGKNPLS